jgi:antitoxin ParD1/3/4
LTETRRTGRLSKRKVGVARPAEESNAMEVALPPDLEEMVREKVAVGDYGSPVEVITAALRLREARLADLRREIAVGIEQLERGEYVEYDENTLPEFAAKVKAEGRDRLRCALEP